MRTLLSALTCGDMRALAPARVGLLLLFLLSVSASGCAFGTRHALLSYQPSFPQAERSRNITVSVVSFTDQRPNREVIGHVRNGFGMKTAKVVARNKNG